MSNFRDKAREIKAEGAAKRGTFDPQGKPKEWYQYWLANSNTEKADDIRYGTRKENFCHFWRVVAIWAPLMFLRKKVGEPILDWDYLGPFLGLLLALGVVTVILTTEGLVGIGVFVAVIVGLAAFVAVIGGIGYWLENHPDTRDRLVRGLAYLAAMAAPLFIIAFIFKTAGFVGLGILALGIAIAGLVYFNLSNIADWIEGLRARARRKSAEWDRQADAARQAYFDEHGYFPNQKPKKAPGRVSRFFTGVGDFIVMAAQVVRVKKWGICPIVEIDTKEIA